MKKYIVLIAIFAVLILGCSQQQQAQQPTTTSGTGSTTSGSSTGGVVEIKMTAKQFEYSPNTITVHKGDKVRLLITSLDVTHGFTIPDFGVTATLTPGQTTTVEFTADKAGTFNFHCNIVCGAGHSSMSGTLVVQ